MLSAGAALFDELTGPPRFLPPSRALHYVNALIVPQVRGCSFEVEVGRARNGCGENRSVGCSAGCEMELLRRRSFTPTASSSQAQRDPGPTELFGAVACPPAGYPLVLDSDGRPALGRWGEGSKTRAAVTEALKTRSARSLAAAKLALDAALGQVAIAVAMVMAGTGDLSTLQVRTFDAGGDVGLRVYVFERGRGLAVSVMPLAINLQVPFIVL